MKTAPDRSSARAAPTGRLVALVRGLLVVVLLLAGGCHEEATQLILRVDSDIPTPFDAGPLESVQVRVARVADGVSIFDAVIDLSDGGHVIPGDVAITARDPDDTRPMRAVVTGRLQGGSTLTRELVLRFVPRRRVLVEVFLADRCRTAEMCPAGATCGRTACEREDGAPVLDFTPLPERRPPPGDPSVVAPRPLAPLSTAMVTSQRPTLRWSLVSGTDGARVQVCRDRACAMSERVFAVSGDRATLSGALAAGVHYWRLYGRRGAVTGLTPGPVWEFFVGERSATASTSSGGVPDFNGDGFADLVLGAANVGRTGGVQVYAGSSRGLPPAPSALLALPDGLGEGASPNVANAGDVNGDGFADLAVAAQGISSRAGLCNVFLGSPTGLANPAAFTLTSPVGLEGGFGGAVVGADDTNGDGFADFAVAAPGNSTTLGRVFLYLGSAQGPALAPTPLTTSESNTAFGYALASAGDLNGDGFGDLVVGAPYVGFDVGSAYVFLGGARGPTMGAVLNHPGGARGIFGSALGSGDFNGDGLTDLVVGAPFADDSRGRAYVYLGRQGAAPNTPAQSLSRPDSDRTHFGHSVAGVGDVNRDGYEDLIVGNPDDALVAMPAPDEYTGEAHFYLGGAGAEPVRLTVSITGPETGRGFGWVVRGVGDLNGDRHADVAVTAFNLGNPDGQVYLFRGRTLGLPVAPDQSLRGGRLSFFGNSIAGIR